MSAGELESGNAGEPAKLIRQRYREASDVIKKGKLCSLFINDLDAGAPFKSKPPSQPPTHLSALNPLFLHTSHIMEQ